MATIPPLQTLTALLNPATATNSLDNLPAHIPADPQACYAYFDLFLRLAAVLGTDLQADPRYDAVLDSLAQCIDQILDAQNPEWFLAAPQSIAAETWAKLGTQHEGFAPSIGGRSASTSVLLHLYNDLMGLLSALTVPTISWTLALAHFVRAAVPALHAHLWVTFQTMEQTSDAIMLTLLEMMEIECVSASTARNVEEKTQPPIRAVRSMGSILFNGNTGAIALFQDCQIGSEYKQFASDDLKMAMMHLSRLAWYNKNTLHNLIRHVDDAGTSCHDQHQPTSDTPNSFLSTNPLTTPTLLDPPPGDPRVRTALLAAGLSHWTRQTVLLSPTAFASHLRDLVLARYPSDRKSIIDFLLVEWTVRIPAHTALVLQPLVDLLRARRAEYNLRTSPFYAHVGLFDPPIEAPGGELGATAGERTGGGWDPAVMMEVPKLEACHHALVYLTEQNVGGELTTWIIESWVVAPAPVLRRHTEWLVMKVNEHVVKTSESIKSKSDDNAMDIDVTEDFYSRQLLTLLTNPRLQLTPARSAVPVLLRTITDAAFLDLARRSPSLPVLLEVFFDSQPGGLSDRFLVPDLLRMRSPMYMDALLAVLGVGLTRPPQGPRPSAWFAAHFLRPLVELAAQPKRYPVAAGLLHRLFREPGSFAYHFLGERSAGRERWAMAGRALGTHLVLDLDPQGGLVQLLRTIGRTSDREREVEVVEAWEQAWAGDTGCGGPPSDFVLCAVAAYARAPASVQRVVERLVRKVISAAVGARAFVTAAIDVLLLSEGTGDGAEALFEVLVEAAAEIKGAGGVDGVLGCVVKVLGDAAAGVDGEPASVMEGEPASVGGIVGMMRMDFDDERGKHRRGGRGRRKNRKKKRRVQRGGKENESDDTAGPPLDLHHDQHQPGVLTSVNKRPSIALSPPLRYARRAIRFLDALLNHRRAPGFSDTLLARLASETRVYQALATCYVRTAGWPVLQQEVMALIISLWTRLGDQEGQVRVKEVLEASGVFEGMGG